jgi:hypothetical protein
MIKAAPTHSQSINGLILAVIVTFPSDVNSSNETQTSSNTPVSMAARDLAPICGLAG